MTAKYFFGTVLVIMSVLVPGAVFAGGIVPCDTNCGFTDLLELGKRIMNFIVYLAVPVATILFAYAGFLYITAVGDSGKIRKAHNIFWSVLWGFVFIAAAYLIVIVILETLQAGTGRQYLDIIRR